MLKVLLRRKTWYLYISFGLVVMVLLDLLYWLTPIATVFPQISTLMIIFNRNIMNILIIAGALLVLHYALMKMEIEQIEGGGDDDE